MTNDPVPYVSATTTETLIRQSRRLLKSLADTQHNLEHFVGLLQQQASEEIGDDDERERSASHSEPTE